MIKNVKQFLWPVKATVIVLCKGVDSCLDRNLPRTWKRHNSISIILNLVANHCWVLGTKSCTLWRSCEPVVWQVLTHFFHFGHSENALNILFKIRLVPCCFYFWLKCKNGSQHDIDFLHYSSLLKMLPIRTYRSTHMLQCGDWYETRHFPGD